MAGRSEYLDFSKGVLILLVVIGHSIQYVAYQGIGFWDDPLFKSIYMFHMPLFMAVSGYVSTPGLVSTDPVSLITSKASSYLTPIIVWGLLAVSWLILRDGFVLTKAMLAEEFIGRLWFLWALFGSLILTAVARACGRYWLLAVALMFGVLLAIPDKAILHLFKYTYPFFLLGHIAALRAAQVPSSTRLAGLAALTGIASAVCFYAWHEETYIYLSKMALTSANVGNIALRYAGGAVASIFALCVFYWAYGRLPNRARSVLVTAGKDSIYIYVVSSYAFTLALQLSLRYLTPAQGAAMAALVSIVSGGAITYLCWLIGDLISKNPVAARFLFGKRKRIQSVAPANRSMPDKRVT